MIPKSYLIVSPAKPSETEQAIASQRQSIPLVWAFAITSPSTKLHREEGLYYFETTVGNALATLDRGLAAWNYNSYFQDLFAPFGVFRSWLANYPSETSLYLNITPLITSSTSAEKDLDELDRLPAKVMIAIGEIEQKDFTLFVQELRNLSYPLVTVPITGHRATDREILALEVRDTPTVEAELALQLVGHDRDDTMYTAAVESIRLTKQELPKEAPAPPPPPFTILYATHLDESRRLLETMGASIVCEGQGRVTMSAGDKEFLLVDIGEHEGRSQSSGRQGFFRAFRR